MGLDITAYSNLKVVTAEEHDAKDEDWCEEGDHVTAFADAVFPRSFRGLEGWDLTEIGHGFRGGLCYATGERTETIRFRAGSYGGYGMWRRDLAEFVGHDLEGDYWGTTDDLENLPFYELLNFADNEGCIGPEAAKDLLADFQTHGERYRATHDDYFVAKYDDWTRACELASQDGLISFH